MKSAIVYFSQTGNTKKIAEFIQNGIKSTTGQCDILKLKEVKGKDLIRYDLIGLGCPVFGYREPANVKAFIDSLPQLKGKHCFVFVTHGTVLGKTLATMSWALHQKGIVVIGSFHCYADVFVPSIPYPWFTTGHPDEVDFKEAEAFGKEIVGISKSIAKGKTSLIPPVKKADWGQAFQAHLTMPLNREKCRYPKCHLCIDNCPVNGIDLSAKPIVFQRDCISCFYCEQICPYGAIEVDWETFWQMLQPRYQGYRKAATKAERLGLLRRYYDVEIDNPDKIRFKVFSKRPCAKPC